jgi:hypothetical protein
VNKSLEKKYSTPTQEDYQMPKYIKSKDGKFAGSIGDGKNAVPTPAPLTVPTLTSPETTTADLDSIYNQFQNEAAIGTPVNMDNVWELHEDADVSFWHCGRPGNWEYSETTGDDEIYCSKCQTMLDVDSDIVPTDALADNPPFTIGQSYTTHRSNVTGTIQEIVPNATGSYRIRLDVDGQERWTTAIISK